MMSSMSPSQMADMQRQAASSGLGGGGAGGAVPPPHHAPRQSLSSTPVIEVVGAADLLVLKSDLSQSTGVPNPTNV